MIGALLTVTLLMSSSQVLITSIPPRADTVLVERCGVPPSEVTLTLNDRTVVVRFLCASGAEGLTAVAAPDSTAASGRSVAATDAREAVDRTPRLALQTLHRGGDAVAIDYSAAPRPGDTRLQVFDVAGRCVGDLAVEPAPNGRGIAHWQPAGGSGVYFVRLTRPDAVLTRRLVLLR